MFEKWETALLEDPTQGPARLPLEFELGAIGALELDRSHDADALQPRGRAYGPIADGRRREPDEEADEEEEALDDEEAAEAEDGEDFDDDLDEEEFDDEDDEDFDDEEDWDEEQEEK